MAGPGPFAVLFSIVCGSVDVNYYEYGISQQPAIDRPLLLPGPPSPRARADTRQLRVYPTTCTQLSDTAKCLQVAMLLIIMITTMIL